MRISAIPASILALALGSALGSGCVQPEANSHAHSDSGITGPSYDAILSELRGLERQHSGIAKVLEYGTTIGGRQLAMIRIGRPDADATPAPDGATRPAVIITGSIHGNEFLGIENRLPRWFLEHQTSPGVAKFLASGGLIYVAPILNPDGYAARQRENRRGQDLNRDFDMKLAGKRGFTQPETRGLAEILRRERDEQRAAYKLTFDYHCCVGALIYPWGHSQTAKLPAPELAEHKRMARLVLESFPSYDSGQAYDVVGYTAVGASDDYFHETFGATSFTFEGAVRTEVQNFDRHTAMWDRLLADRAGESLPPQGSGNKPTLAVYGDGPSVRVGMAADSAATMALCRGSVSTCTGANPEIIVRLSQSRSSGGRVIFSGDATLSFTGSETLTVLALDAAGRVTGSAAVQVSRL